MGEGPLPEDPTSDGLSPLIPGRIILGRYTLKRVLGIGAFGVVWLAHDEELSIEVAIKLLSDAIRMNPEAVADLKRETRHSLRLTHPHIVRTHGFLQGPDLAGISMEYVDGPTLSRLKLDRPSRCLEAADLAPWVVQICDALDYAHERAQIVHRDLKPGNLMINAAGEIKVADFGISRSISDTHTRLTQTKGISGTPAFMSPQQLLGEPPRVSDDVYSLGATLYDLLAGKPPFHTGDISIQVLHAEPPSVSRRRAELGITGLPVPPEWERTLAAALAKRPEDRPRDVREFARSLGLPAPIREIPAAARRPRRVLLFAGGAVAAIALVAFGALLLGPDREPPAVRPPGTGGPPAPRPERGSGFPFGPRTDSLLATIPGARDSLSARILEMADSIRAAIGADDWMRAAEAMKELSRRRSGNAAIPHWGESLAPENRMVEEEIATLRAETRQAIEQKNWEGARAMLDALLVLSPQDSSAEAFRRAIREGRIAPAQGPPPGSR